MRYFVFVFQTFQNVFLACSQRRHQESNCRQVENDVSEQQKGWLNIKYRQFDIISSPSGLQSFITPGTTSGTDEASQVEKKNGEDDKAISLAPPVLSSES